MDKSPQVFEALILINNKLQQKEAAEGLLEYVMAHRNAADELKVSAILDFYTLRKK